MLDIFALIGIPTTTIGVMWMLVRIGIWYWYNRTVGGKAAASRTLPCIDYSFAALMRAPVAVIVLGLIMWIFI